jgi:predicted transcriptional regulator
MISADMMREILQNSEMIRQILPTAQQLKILKYIANREVTSNDLAVFFNISIANAGGQLSKLHRNGWLRRSDVGDPTGGSMYVYKNTLSV